MYVHRVKAIASPTVAEELTPRLPSRVSCQTLEPRSRTQPAPLNAALVVVSSGAEIATFHFFPSEMTV